MTLTKIEGKTTINVGTDLYVGNSIFIGDQVSGVFKKICFNENTYIEFCNFSLVISRGISELFMSENSAFLKNNNNSFVPFYTDLTEKYTTLGGNVTVADKLTVGKDLSVSGNITIVGNLSVIGDKSRIVKTDHYGIRKLNAVESAHCYFTDEGQVLLDDHGRASINFDPIWLETVNTTKPYHMQLTPYCEICPWIVEEYPDHCVIAGKPNTKVNWHISALQKDFENVRLEELKKEGEQNGYHSNTD